MAAVKALETAIGADMARFSAHLWTQRIPHRVFDVGGGRQVIVVATEEHAARVREDFRRWREDGVALAPPGEAPPAAGGGSLRRALRAAPLSFALLLLCAAGAVLVALDGELRLLHWFTFTEVRIAGHELEFDSVASTYGRGEYWRLITPVFLHFGALHLVFNALWMWELGRRVERARGAATLFAVMVITGAGGNIAQYVIGASVMFGGMSGVIYGLLGYAWMWTRFTGDPQLQLPRGLLGFMLGWLVVCMSGITEVIGFGAIANAAHAAGLVLGVALGLGAALLYSPPRASGP